MIKDSGERREFETGAIRDMHEGKGRMDLLWAVQMTVHHPELVDVPWNKGEEDGTCTYYWASTK